MESFVLIEAFANLITGLLALIIALTSLEFFVVFVAGVVSGLHFLLFMIAIIGIMPALSEKNSSSTTV